MQEQLKNHIAHVWTAVWDHGDVDALDDLLTPDYARRSATSGQVIAADELQREVREIRSAFPDLRTTIDALVIDGDSGAIFWHTEGTFSAPLHGVPPTGRRVVTKGSNALTLRDGRIAEEVVTWDASGLLADIGVPSLASAFESAPPMADGLLAPVDESLIKGFNRQFYTGVTVVTTIDAEGRPKGLAANSFASVSIEPPLVLICVQKTSSTYPALFSASHLGINILSTRQLDVVKTFAGRGDDKFASLDWEAAPQGSPLIAGSSARLEAEIKERLQVRTHTVFIGRVAHAEVTDEPPMIYRAGHFYDSTALTEL